MKNKKNITSEPVRIALGVMDGNTKVIPTFIEKDTFKDYLN